MKRKTLIFYSLLLLSISLKGQNPLIAFNVYQYETDNNKINVDKELENKFENLSFTNVFFKYYKNHMYNETFRSDKIMLFRVQYEYLIQNKVDENIGTSFKFLFNKKYDKISKIKLTGYSQENGKIITSKLSKNEYEVLIDDSVITIKPNKGALKMNTTLRVYCSIESIDINLKNLSPLKKNPNSSIYISFNVPEIFKYKSDNDKLELQRKEQGSMKLIKFTYDMNDLTENCNVPSATFMWKIKNGFDNLDIYFPLISINLPDGIGTSTQEIINKGK